MTPVFGEFLALASEHVSAATLPPGELADEARHGIIRELARLATAMARYARDPGLPDAFDPAAPCAPTASQRAALDARLALGHAAENLMLAAHGVADHDAAAAHTVEGHLRAAADSLAAGCDLLRTHTAATPTNAQATHSPWAPVITSLPVTTALLAELAGYAQQLAPVVADLSLPRPGIPVPACQALRAASSWLRVAGSAVAATRQPAPPDAGRQLLASIPLNFPPPRRVPAGTETVADLCAGAAGTAERLRHIAVRSAGLSRWPPAATATSWQRGALATAIIGHNSEYLLRTLATRARQLRLARALAPGIERTAETMRQAWTSWQAIVRAWDVITTGNSRGISPVAAELGDLVLWAGQLAHDGQHWTPARNSISPWRDGAHLAPTASDIMTVLTAIHRTIDTAALIARLDKNSVEQSAADNMLYVPTRLLPERLDIFYRYSQAPGMRITELLTTYNTAASTAERAAAALHDLLASSHAPSAVHAANRTAMQNAAVAARHREDSSMRAAGRPAALPAPPRHVDDLGRLLRSLRISEPALLLRATAIEHAARDLIAEATAKSRRRTRASSPDPSPTSRASAAHGQAARLANQDHPGIPGADQPARHDHEQNATRRNTSPHTGTKHTTRSPAP